MVTFIYIVPIISNYEIYNDFLVIKTLKKLIQGLRLFLLLFDTHLFCTKIYTYIRTC